MLPPNEGKKIMGFIPWERVGKLDGAFILEVEPEILSERPHTTLSFTTPILFLTKLTDQSEEREENSEGGGGFGYPVTFHAVNHSNRPIRFVKGTIMGRLTPLDDRKGANSILGEGLEGKNLEEELDIPRTEPDLTPATSEEIDSFVNEMKELSKEQRERVRKLFHKYHNVFSLTPVTPNMSSLPPHRIELREGSRPVSSRPHHLSPEKRETMRKIVKEYRETGITRPSTSEFSAPMLLVRKPDGSWRYVVDYRKLNEITIPDRFPLPRLDEILDAMGGAEWFSGMDLATGFLQIPVAEEDRHKQLLYTLTA